MFHPFEKSGRPEADREALIGALRALSDPDRIATLANASALLNWYLEDVNWVGFYLWSEAEGELILGPYQGLPACLRIAPGRGVCGAAYRDRSTTIVDDVLAFPGHIACDAASRSELVVPLLTGDAVWGVLDIDSPTPARFGPGDAALAEAFAAALSEFLHSRD